MNRYERIAAYLADVDVEKVGSTDGALDIVAVLDADDDAEVARIIDDATRGIHVHD